MTVEQLTVVALCDGNYRIYVIILELYQGNIHCLIRSICIIAQFVQHSSRCLTCHAGADLLVKQWGLAQQNLLKDLKQH